MKVAIIGAGLSGLTSLKHCMAENYFVDVFEQTGLIGGVWNYSDQYGIDEDGIPIHTVMYKDLTTNLPKDLMTLNEFPYPDHPPSYLPQERVLKYFQDYTKHFNLLPHIKFFSQVIKVEPTNSTKWEITIKDLKTKMIQTKEYDAVMVCNGHYHSPRYPNIPGKEKFNGKQLHSSVYRTPDIFKDKKVLIIGAGASGVDIAEKVEKVAEKVIISFNKENLFKLSKTLNLKPLVKEIYEDGVIFVDGTNENVDVIIYCTGYLYKFPFLSERCGIKIDNRWVKYLYKSVINVEYPTMGFIGITWECCVVPVTETQVRFFVASLKQTFPLPSKEEMMEDINNHLKYIKSLGWTEKDMHRCGVDQGRYFDDVTSTARIEKVPSVLHKLYLQVRKDRSNRKVYYKVIDDDNFIQTQLL
ncbi:uncharacterized protein [Onthophagus taurus]|uniref:uncharacterized protein isoform X1 n=1 Tax=Onthophagus taurus TaxID=166361 RepID=UPI0039BE3C59